MSEVRRENRLRHYRNIGVVVLLLLIGAAVGTLTWPALDDRPAAEPVSLAVIAPGRSAKTNEAASAGDPSHSHDQSRSEERAIIVEDPEVEPNEAKLIVRCVSRAGERVPGVRLHCVVTDRKPAASLTNTHRTVTEIVRTTDEQGEFALTSSRDHWLQIYLKDDEWHTEPYDADRAVSFARTEPVEMVLLALSGVRIRAVYDDGEPVTTNGALYFPASAEERAANPANARSWRFNLSKDGTALAKVPVDQALLLRLGTSRARAGYHDYFEVLSAPELQSGQEFHVVVPRAESHDGAIRIEFPTPPVTRGLLVLESDPPWRGLRNRIGSGTAAFEFWPLEPGKYRLTYTSDPSRSFDEQSLLAWRSDWIEIKEREIRVVKAALQLAATVRARLMDPQANPLSHAGLQLRHGESYMRYKRGRGEHPVPRANQADDQGIVVLRGLPPGEVEIEAEAWGMAPVVMQVELAPGAVVDLGDLILQRAAGRISVELTGMLEGREYSVILSDAVVGGTISPHLRAEGGKYTFHVPPRLYTVSATFRHGGSVVNARVELSDDNPVQTVLIDVSELEPTPSPLD